MTHHSKARPSLVLVLALFPGLAAAQTDCLRPDEEKMMAAANRAMASGSARELPRITKKVSGCTPYAVSFRSTLTTVVGGVTTTIAGRGALVIPLASDPSEPDFALTSGPEDVIGTVTWTGVSMAGGPCAYAVVPGAPTPFSFWLGVATGTEGRRELVVTPAGHDMHTVTVKCRQGAGPAQPTPIFSPAWMTLHGMGGTAAATAAMDPAAMTAMAERFKDRQPTQDEAMKLIQQMMPNAAEQVEAARNNFRFKMNGPRHAIDRTVTLPGGGTIREVTVIEVSRGGAPR